ncbi:response regulator [Coleofasciculus sp. FACHB-1120]|uniref:response regulator n=1 Tax=Coleofasciculus sp. FACHB-1120 TaxID=2692783 RepID=UPI0016824811|nr:response regulator [Coleofasciculus sp. FACHB-1120]MBD2740160.1 response regulator [Coleofasciculus sp. FACHB-1120]
MLNVSNYTILLVEDDSNDVFLIQRAFRKANLLNPLQVVENGEAAVFYLAGKQPYSDRDRYPLPALILLDLKLPRKSGLEVLEWLRQQPDLKRLPVVVLTSSEENRDINRAYDLGANSYLVKPVAFEALLDMVKTLNSYWLIFNQRPKLEEG